jgi:hypothetical protein
MTSNDRSLQSCGPEGAASEGVVIAVTTLVTAFITVPATLVAGHWTRRSMGRAADAAVAVGLGQSEAAVQAARLQGRADREHALESERRVAYTQLFAQQTFSYERCESYQPFPMSPARAY